MTSIRLIPQRYQHVAFGVVQSGLTSCIAAGIASVSFGTDGGFFKHWLMSWLISWGLMLPVVIIAAPAIESLISRVTYPD